MVGQGLVERGEFEVERTCKRLGVDAIVMLQYVEHRPADRRIRQNAIEEADDESSESKRDRRNFGLVSVEASRAQNEIAM